MGTTCSVLVLLPRGAILGHIGDSRIYRVRNGTIDQLSRDHSLVWELESAGGMSREEAAEAAPKNIITRSMGPHPHAEIDLEGPHPVESATPSSSAVTDSPVRRATRRSDCWPRNWNPERRQTRWLAWRSFGVRPTT
jgi:serine/threonine protein phosphatase PrpC